MQTKSIVNNNMKGKFKSHLHCSTNNEIFLIFKLKYWFHNILAKYLFHEI